MTKIYGKTQIFAKAFFVPIPIKSSVPQLPTTIIWTGLGSNNNWSTSSNWNIRAPQAYDILQFAGTTRLAPFNDLTIDTPYNGITFNSGAGAFTLNGNRFVLNSGSISNSSINIQTINNDIVLGTNAGTINCATSSINLNGNISGSGSLTKLGASTLSLSGNNSYTGNTYINAGIVIAGNNNPFGTGVAFISSNAGTLTIDANSIPSTVVINNTLNCENINPSIRFNKSTTFNGAVNIITMLGNAGLTTSNANTVVTFNNTLSATTAVSIFLLNNITTGAQMIFNSPVILDTAAFQADVGGGCKYIFNVTGNKLNTLRGSGLFVCGVANAFSQYRTGINLGRRTGQQVFGQINLNGTMQTFGSIVNTTTPFSDCSGCNIFNNTLTTSNLTLSANAATATYTGSISGNINLIKSGTYTQTLSGSTVLGIGPRHTGFTAISAGTLTNYVLSSNPSNKVNFAQFTNTALTVNFTTPPVVGDSFILLSGRTVNLYPSVTLQNASGRTASYNSTTSTLSVIT